MPPVRLKSVWARTEYPNRSSRKGLERWPVWAGYLFQFGLRRLGQSTRTLSLRDSKYLITPSAVKVFPNPTLSAMMQPLCRS